MGQAQPSRRSARPWHPALQRGKSTGRGGASGLTLAAMPYRGRGAEDQARARWGRAESVWFSVEMPEGDGPAAEASERRRTPRWVSPGRPRVMDRGPQGPAEADRGRLGCRRAASGFSSTVGAEA